MSEKAAKRPNRCESFAFCGIDAFSEIDECKPEKRKAKDFVQTSLFGFTEKEDGE